MAQLFGVNYNYFYAPAYAGELLSEGILYELENYRGTAQQWFENEYGPWFREIKNILLPVLERADRQGREDAQLFIAMGQRLAGMPPEEAARRIEKWNDCHDLADIISGNFCRVVPNVFILPAKKTGVAEIPCCNLPQLGCNYLGERLNGNGTRVCNKAFGRLTQKNLHILKSEKTAEQISANQNT